MSREQVLSRLSGEGSPTAQLNFVRFGRFQPGSRELTLRDVFRQFGQSLAVLLWRRDDFHLLPVIWELLAAIQTSNVGSR